MWCAHHPHLLLLCLHRCISQAQMGFSAMRSRAWHALNNGRQMTSQLHLMMASADVDTFLMWRAIRAAWFIMGAQVARDLMSHILCIGGWTSSKYKLVLDGNYEYSQFSEDVHLLVGIFKSERTILANRKGSQSNWEDTTSPYNKVVKSAKQHSEMTSAACFYSIKKLLLHTLKVKSLMLLFYAKSCHHHHHLQNK